MKDRFEQDQVHSSNLDIKTVMRVGALADAGEGPIFVPYCGFGECAQAAEYPTDRIFGCDVDRAAVDHWKGTWPEARIIVADVLKFRAWPTEPISMADFDAYGNPWRALDKFLTTAPTANVVQVLVTDGSNEYRTRGKKPYNFVSHKWEQMHSVRAVEQSDNLQEVLVGWLGNLGWQAEVRDCQKTGWMYYWWFTLTKTSDALASVRVEESDVWGIIEEARDRLDLPMVYQPEGYGDLTRGQKSKLTQGMAEFLADAIGRYGVTVAVACEAAGISRTTYSTWMRTGANAKTGKHRDFVDLMQQAQSMWEVDAVRRITEAGRFGEKTITIEEDAEGGVTKRIEIRPQWRALAWLMARRIPERYSQKVITEGKVEVTETSARPFLIEVVETKHKGPENSDDDQPDPEA